MSNQSRRARPRACEVVSEAGSCSGEDAGAYFSGGRAYSRTAQIAIIICSVLFFLGANDEARFRDLGHRLMCVCGCNQILLECNHVGCRYSDSMRAELMSAVERGDSDDLTLQAFVQKYGTTVLLAPTTTGFNRVAWIVPYLVLVLGVTMVILIVRAWRRRPLTASPNDVVAISGSELAHFREQARKETDL